ncbi:hypothetical protein [Paenibacillus planticolens]|uniref:hypothetical protein n=1 Tax=Paenibacillus planticolens TaxID=2654976 RepID=UPI0014920AE9|nr:hypothetical protein [Paenibacillus planticolens]
MSDIIFVISTLSHRNRPNQEKGLILNAKDLIKTYGVIAINGCIIGDTLNASVYKFAGFENEER